MHYTLQVRKSPRGFWDVELMDSSESYIFEVTEYEVNTVLGICGLLTEVEDLNNTIFREIQRVDFTETLEYLTDTVFKNEEIF